MRELILKFGFVSVYIFLTVFSLQPSLYLPQQTGFKWKACSTKSRQASNSNGSGGKTSGGRMIERIYHRFDVVQRERKKKGTLDKAIEIVHIEMRGEKERQERTDTKESEVKITISTPDQTHHQQNAAQLL